MPEFQSEDYGVRDQRRADAGTVEQYSTLKRQYLRAREYCGFTLDELINSRSAKNTLRDIWLVGCMVRKPQKANVLPPGNPFRGPDVLVSSPSRPVRPSQKSSTQNV